MTETPATPLPYLNIGCGKVVLPCAKPAHHALLPDELYAYPFWVNIDRNEANNVDLVRDMFEYPWRTLPDNAFGGALLSHICEHIPHEIKTGGILSSATPVEKEVAINGFRRMRAMQDGWFCFFSELWRVLVHGAEVHVLSPYALSTGALADPTHTRLIVPESFLYTMPNPMGQEAYEYNMEAKFEVSQPRWGVNEENWSTNRHNSVSEFYMVLRAVKEEPAQQGDDSDAEAS